MSWKFALSSAGCVLAGALGARLWMPVPVDTAALARPEQADARASVPKVVTEVPTLAHAAVMRSIVREEIENGLADVAAKQAASAGSIADSPGSGAEPPGVDPSEPEAADEPSPSYSRATAYVTERLARGTWTEEDRNEVGAALGAMSDPERRDIMGRVIRAVNENSLRIEVRGPLF